MIYNFNSVIYDLDDKPMNQSDDGQIETLTFGKVARGALVSLDDDEMKLSGEKKNSRFILTCDIKRAEKGDGKLDIGTDEASWIKAAIEKKYRNLVVIGRCQDILKNEGEKPIKE